MTTLSPLDMLFMSENEQKVLSFLTRTPEATLTKIAQFTGIAMDELEKLVHSLVHDAHMVEKKKNGEKVYAVTYGHAEENIRNLPNTLDIFS